MQTKEKGFTLVEIAIVLVIIGLLLGGVMKGQELIANSKLKSMKNDIDGIATAVYAYQDRFRALPGDDVNVASYLTGATAPTGNNAGNGLIDNEWDSTTDDQESRLAFQHLRLAGLLKGTGQSQPLSPYGTIMGIESGDEAGFNDVLKVCVDNLDRAVAQQFDIQHDDGVYNTGSVRTSADFTQAGNPIELCSKI